MVIPDFVAELSSFVHCCIKTEAFENLTNSFIHFRLYLPFVITLNDYVDSNQWNEHNSVRNC